jgi:EAL domain-containing protein (putative c-di-GMP-specific phosphodiesterase class I)
VVTLGTTLGLETIAEGIESEDQASALRELGCVAGQGFLFARSTTLDLIAGSTYMARRMELRVDHATADLTATGRYQVDELWRHSAAG